MSRSKEDLARRLEELRAENATRPAPVVAIAPSPDTSAPANDAAPELEAPPAPESGPLEVQPDRDSEMDGQGEGDPAEPSPPVEEAPPGEDGDEEPERIAGALATFCCADNKIRVQFPARLPRDLYLRLKGAGFQWARFQGVFVAPAWSPQREDLATALAGPLEDEDMTPAERAEDRAERFNRYEANRERDAHAARAGVERITDGIPLGQPILVGHHSERRARKDAERIERGMRKAVDMWSRKEYWERRAAGVIALPKYRERPEVRHRRIKGLEAELRKYTKDLDRSRAFRAAWAKADLSREGALKIANYDHVRSDAWSALQDEGADVAAIAAKAIQAYDRAIAWRQRWADHTENRLAYERAMLGESGGITADGFKLEVGGRVLCRHWNSRRAGWTVIVKVNRASDADGGAIVSVSTPGGLVPVETITDYRAPEEGDAAKVKAARKLPPLVNYPGEGFVEMTRARWDRHAADEKKAHTAKAAETHGAYRYRMSWVPGGNWKTAQVFLTDEKIVERPLAPKAPPPHPERECDDGGEEDGDASEAPSSEEGEAMEGGAGSPSGVSLGESSASASPRPTSAPLGAPCGAESAEPPAPAAEPLTVKLHGTAVEVLAKLYKGRPSAMTYANRTQATAAAAKLGEGWAVIGRGRPLYVANVAAAAPAAPAPHKAPAGALAGRGEPEAEPLPPCAPTPQAPLPSTTPDLAPPTGSLAAELDANEPGAPADPRALLAPVVDALVLARQFRENERAAERRTAREVKEAAAAPFRALERALKGKKPGAPLVETVVVPELFPTPAALAGRLVTAAGVKGRMRVLEPSAGTGALASECLTRGATVVLVEVNAHAATMLETFRSKAERQATGGKVERVHHADFLTLGLSELGTFNAIVMNPPFSAEIEHVTHALSFLNYGGTLAAIMSAAVGFRCEKKYEAFREKIAAMKGEIVDLPPGSFKPQTDVNTVMVRVTK